MVAKVYKLKSVGQAVAYYAEDDYYSRGAEGPPYWYGKGAEYLGLDGKAVDHEMLRQLLEGRLPDGSRIHRGGKEARCGTDITFSPPKSFSIAYARAKDPAEKAALLAMHEHNVRKALDYVQAYVSCRRTEDGRTSPEQTGNLVIMLAPHQTNRYGDMQVHTHAVAMKMTKNRDGEWRALDNHLFFDIQKLAGAIYHSGLHRDLENAGIATRDLGHSRAKNGEFELAHITDDQIKTFSHGREAIRENLERKGIDIRNSTEEQRQAANYEEREAKQSYDRRELQARWDADLDAAGVTDIQIQTKEAMYEQRIYERIEQSRSPRGAAAAIEYNASLAAVGVGIEGTGERRDPIVAETGREATGEDAGHGDRHGQEPDPDRSRDHRELRDGGTARDGKHLPELHSPDVPCVSGLRGDAVLREDVPDDRAEHFGLHEPPNGGGSQTEESLSDLGALAAGAPAREAIRSALRSLQKKSSLVSEHEVLRYSLANSGIVLDEAQAALAQLKQEGEILSGQPGGQIIERENGREEFRPGKVLLTTALALDREKDLIARFEAGKAQGKAAMSSAQAAMYLTKYQVELKADAAAKGLTGWKANGLNDGQMRVAEAILTNQDRFLAVRGPAGSGKTFVLKQIERALAEHEKHLPPNQRTRLIAIAPTYKATGELQKVLGQGEVSAKFLVDRRQHKDLGPNTLIICDEFGMADTETASALAQLMDKTGARLVAIGDLQQLAGVGAGRPFAQMQQHARLEEMDVSVRQEEGSKIEGVVRALNEMRYDLALDRLKESGMVKFIENDQERKQAMVEAYLADIGDIQDPEQQLKKSAMLVTSNAERRELSELARETLGLKGLGVDLSVLDPRQDLNAEQLRFTRFYDVGDVVKVDRDYKSLGLKKGQVATIAKVEKDHLVLDNGKQFYPQRGYDLERIKVFVRRNEEFAVGDLVRMRETIKERGGKVTVANNDYGRVEAIDDKKIHIRIEGKLHSLSHRDLAIQHGYAVTTYGIQGASISTPVMGLGPDQANAYTNLTRTVRDARVFARNEQELERALRTETVKWNAEDLANTEPRRVQAPQQAKQKDSAFAPFVFKTERPAPAPVPATQHQHDHQAEITD